MMGEGETRSILLNFFKSLKCSVDEKPDYLLVKNIPEKFEKSFSIKSPVKFYFQKEKASSEGILVSTESDIVRKIKDYLKNTSSKTLLRIDFEFPINVRDKIKLRNCSMNKIEKKHENNYFSRFSFITNLRYLNNTEQILNEIFVHDGKIVKGDLSDYNVKEGDFKEASSEHLEADYKIAKDFLREALKNKISEASHVLDDKMKSELSRVEAHYGQVMKEFSLQKNRFLERIKEAELQKDMEKFNKLSEAFENSFGPIEEKRILDEKLVVTNNEKSKFSLDIENKLINTTIIYYPIFSLTLSLNEGGFVKNVEIKYNPLTEEISKLNCDSCKSVLEQVNVCNGGHICCDSCLHLCQECGKRYCRLCFVGICDNCGKLVCKNCMRKCVDCGKLHCKNCMRKSDKSGFEKCLNCVVYCPICSKIVEKKQLVRGNDGRMICRDCSKKK